MINNKEMSNKKKLEKELVVKYLSGDVDFGEKKSIESDIADNPEMKKYLDTSVAVWDMLDSADQIEPNPNYISIFWNSVKEDEKNPGILEKIKTFNTKWVFITSFATLLLVSSLLINVFVMQHNDINNNLVFNTEDEIIFNNLDKSLTKKTAAYLDVFGPWEE